MAGVVSRREIIAGAGASALALSSGDFAAPGAVARGTVFEDDLGDGTWRAGARGLTGVMVSNGRDVAITDDDGRWSLPVAAGDSVFVIKPPGWATLLSTGGIPWFAYVHQPDGSPRYLGTRFPLVGPTGPLPASIDFPLRRQEEPGDFEALLVSDTQPENAAELGYLRDDIIAAMLGTGAAFAINHGDVVADDLSLYPRYLRLLSATGIPWHHCPGNHDMNSDARDDSCSRETWKRIFGPRHYAFQYAGATFLVLDNVYYFGHNPGLPRSGSYCGRIGEQQLQFVRNVLAQVPFEQLVVVSMHIPLVTYQDPRNPADNTSDRRALLALLSTRPHTVSFSGHMHLIEHHHLGTEHGFAGPGRHHHQVLAAASGSWWGGPRDCGGIPTAICPDGTPNGFHVLSVDGSRYATRFVPAIGKGAGQLRVLVDGPNRRRPQAPVSQTQAATLVGAPISAATLEAHELLVNVFDGSQTTQVIYEVAGSGQSEVRMQRTVMSDPYVAELFAMHPATLKPWVRAVPSSHLWKAPLPAGLAPGAHRLTVRARKQCGAEEVAHVVLEIVAPNVARST